MRKLAYLVAAVAFAASLVTAQEADLLSAVDRRPKLLSEYKLAGLETKLPSFDTMEAMDVVDLVKFLAMKAGMNVIIGKDIAGSSKLMLRDVTIGDALESVLAANGLAYEVRGNILKIMADKDYQAQYGEGFYERKQAKILRLKYASPKAVALLLEPIKGNLGKVVYDDGTGTLVLIDTPEKIREMEAVIQQAELPTIQRVMPTVTTNFVLQYSKVEDIEPQITPLLTKPDVGQIRSDKRTKTLIVTDLPSVLVKVADLVALFDREQKQVFIEAKIIQIKLSDEFKLGVNWEHLFQGLNPRFSLESVSRFPLGFSDVQDSFGRLSYHTIAAGGDLSAVVEALTTVGDTKILSNPHIAALDGQEAMIKVITDEPYAELTYEAGATNITGKTYKFIPVGVALGVTPRINELGFVSVQIKPEISSVIGKYDTAGGQGVPVVKRSVAETTVSVKDGVTIIIAGMIDETKEKTVSRVPVLGWIPILGMLFRSEATKTENTETVVLLTPRIVTGTKYVERLHDLKKETRSNGGTPKKKALPDMPM